MDEGDFHLTKPVRPEDLAKLSDQMTDAKGGGRLIPK
jgi:hypothetical protein